MLISADRIHDGNNFLPEGTTLDIDAAGYITNLLTSPNEETITYEGIICPGFVNVHCHMELSHMKGVISERTGLIPFLQSVVAHRDKADDEIKQAAMWLAYNDMLNNGIVAVGDIANTTGSLSIRADDRMHFHTFIEAIGFSEVNAAKSFGHALTTWEVFGSQIRGICHLTESITPHAPYSVSGPLFHAIATHRATEIISVHNQECSAENEYYSDKKGEITQLLKGLHIDDTFFKPTGKSSLRSYLSNMPVEKQYLLIHNTYTSVEDVRFIRTHFRKSFWGLCPNANLYIEGRLPDVMMLHDEGMEICIGTDSLASNHKLSILDELITLKKGFPILTWEVLIKWATRNGAYALKMEDRLGTIAQGKQPGIVNITGFESGNFTSVRIV